MMCEENALLRAVRDAADDVYDAHMTERSAWPGEREKALLRLEAALDAHQRLVVDKDD